MAPEVQEAAREATLQAQRQGRGARRSTPRAVAVALLVAGLVLLSLVLVLAAVLGTLAAPGHTALALAGVAVALVVGLVTLWALHGLVAGHFRSLDRLRGAVVTLAGDPDAVLPLLREETDSEVAVLHAALADLAARRAGERAAPDRRLQAVLGAITEAIVVVTEQGQVSLVNFPAKALFGAEHVRVGTSIYDALDRAALVAAIDKAGRAGKPLAQELRTTQGGRLAARVARLTDHGGAVLSFAAEAREHRAEVEHDLALHDQPPEPGALDAATPLGELPILVLDTETTGLDVAQDRVVSIGAVRLHGGRIYRAISFDRLVNPGQPIPPRSTAVHGITDAMVADAAPFEAVFRDLVPLLEGCLLLGHNAPFDIAMLRGECARAGVALQDPPFLDTLLLVAALDPAAEALGLEHLAERFGVDVHGRHTALGDCLVTAEVFARLLPQLQDRGVVTLGDAQDFSAQARRILKEQKRAGW